MHSPSRRGSLVAGAKRQIIKSFEVQNAAAPSPALAYHTGWGVEVGIAAPAVATGFGQTPVGSRSCGIVKKKACG